MGSDQEPGGRNGRKEARDTKRKQKKDGETVSMYRSVGRWVVAEDKAREGRGPQSAARNQEPCRNVNRDTTVYTA